MTDTTATITFSELQTLSFCNSKRLPGRIKFEVDGVMYYKEWIGIGWIDDNPNDEAVLVVEE